MLLRILIGLNCDGRATDGLSNQLPACENGRFFPDGMSRWVTEVSYVQFVSGEDFRLSPGRGLSHGRLSTGGRVYIYMFFVFFWSAIAAFFFGLLVIFFKHVAVNGATAACRWWGGQT